MSAQTTPSIGNKGESRRTILVVEDEAVIAADLQDRLTNLGYLVPFTVPSGERALEEAARLCPDLVLMDIMLSGQMDGIETAREIQKCFDVPVVYLTSHSDALTLERAGETEPFGYIVKPFDERELRAAIEIAFYRHKAEKRVRKIERWLSTTLRSIGDGVIATDAVGRITMMNRVSEMLTGWSQREAVGKPFESIFTAFNVLTREPIVSPVSRALKEGVVVELEENTALVRKDGTEIPVDDSAAPIRDDDDNIIGVVVVFRDSSARKEAENKIRRAKEELEERVRQRTSQLEEANRELEAFTYSVSHDLQAPIRAINGFAQLIESDYSEVVDADGKKFLSLLRKNALRMDSMVQDFLRLSKSGHGDLRIEETDMTALVEEVIAEVAAGTTHHPQVTLNPLPSAKTDKSFIVQVWQNLISNAFKYTRNTLNAQITISGHVERNEIIYRVTDNGPGFDPACADRVFEVFQRMHATEEFEGTGIGLAIVKRLVLRHGGRVWAESVPGKGANFYFKLPVL